MRATMRVTAIALTMALAAAPAFGQAPKGNAPKGGADKGPATTPGPKAPAAPDGITATQTDADTVSVVLQGSKDAVDGYRVYVSRGSGGPRLLRAIGRLAGPVVVRVQEIAAALGVPITSLVGGILSFSAEAYDAKGLVSPKASSNTITLKGPDTTPADPGTSTTTTGGTTTTGSPKDLNTPAKGWAAQTSRTEVTLAWDPAKSATSQRVTFEFGGRTFVLATFSSGVARAVFTLQRLAQLAGQRLDAIQASPLVFRIESLVQQRVASVFDFNRVTPVSPAKALASKQAPAGGKAEETGPGEITLTWQAHPDAVAYAIGRAQGNEGFKMICALCSSEQARFVDAEAIPGARHVYTVQAITVDGAGARATSNIVNDPAAKAAAKQ